MPEHYKADKKQLYLQLLQQGHTRKDATEIVGVSYNTGRNWEAGFGINGDTLREWKQQQELPGPIDFKDLKPEAKRALEDFAFFQEYYLGRVALPWQKIAADKIIELLETPYEEFVVLNAPPGSGKSTVFSHDIPAWITVRNRAIRGALGHFGERLAGRYVDRLKKTLEAVVPIKADLIDIQKGIAVDAQGVLAMDFGRFKGDDSYWRQKEFLVEQPMGMRTGEKEATWAAIGQDTSFLGDRYDLIIWDDLYDPRKLRTIESKLDQRDWWDTYAEKRLEPGGLLVLQGQRMDSEDIYRYCLDKPAGWRAGEDEEDEEGQASEDLRDLPDDEVPSPSSDSEVVAPEVDPDVSREDKKYHHIIFKAHYEEICQQHHKLTSAPYPEGCLLSPRRLNWRKLASEMENPGSKFPVVYQQGDSDPATVLVNPLWIDGGTDNATGERYPGCWDHFRSVGVVPKDLARPFFSIATVDVSPTMWWAIHWWIYQPSTQLRFLIDLHSAKMESPDFIDFHPEDNSYSGVMVQWQVRSVDQGAKITHWVVEQNAAQRFLLQQSLVKRYQRLSSISIIGHETHKNKSDPERGVFAIAPHYRYGRVRLPGARDGSRQKMQRLTQELRTYPDSRTTDQVMANWFFEWNIERIAPQRKAAGTVLWRPTWMRAG